MAQTQPLFVLQVPTAVNPGAQQKPIGSFICTEAAPQVYLLAFSDAPDNRLTPSFNATFLLALDIIEHRLPKGVVITTSSITKFYSNGLDYENAVKDPNFFTGMALINGHAFAGGLMTAMMHDYRIMNPHKGFVCLNELDFGAPLQPAMASVFRVKLNLSTFRNMVLESRRYPALEALKEGILDGVGGLEETLAFVHEMKLAQKAQGKSYGLIKEEMNREIVKDLDEATNAVQVTAAKDLDRSRRDLEAKKRVEDYQNGLGIRSKL
ncbi:Enoyl-CoA delta isomerase 1, peroxisomal [Cyphellophora attinorum]|uniref:Enoyl-CoA delta isomerase 1, peroxisomal n=1 Tax=Cyphellophora attinorum TaxID=1664694 RepID=A0A0N1P095_9EURO|nr:Enoyl-CoA delta isomerase 1, peroxisomal [Phialophora attinorum]KPI42340.1 Enoyl-CoA delta isomerase 1, peroxisomal [Phialophora attinorum]